MTLNKVISRIKKIVGDHLQIKTFYFGELTEWVEFSFLQYNSVLLVLNGANISRNEIAYNFTIYIADLLNNGSDNKTEIHSDTVLILNDLFSDFDDQGLYDDWTFEGDGANVTFFDDERGNDNPDIVAGVQCNFTIKTSLVHDRCQIPKRRNGILHEQGFTIFTENNQITVTE